MLGLKMSLSTAALSCTLRFPSWHAAIIKMRYVAEAQKIQDIDRITSRPRIFELERQIGGKR